MYIYIFTHGIFKRPCFIVLFDDFLLLKTSVILDIHRDKTIKITVKAPQHICRSKWIET